MAGVGNYTYLNLLDLGCKRQDWQGKHSSQVGLSPAGNEDLLKDFKQKSHMYNFSFYTDPFSTKVEGEFEENKSENVETSQDAIVIVKARQARGDKGLDYGQKEVDELKKYFQTEVSRTQHGFRCDE